MNGDAPDGSALSGTLAQVGGWLRELDYHFTAVTPATHARLNARPEAQVARSLRDVFGWSRPFDERLLPPRIAAALAGAGLLDRATDRLHRSGVRFSTVGDQLMAHSAYPTDASDAVFFGPDTYRFVTLIEEELRREPLRAHARILDVGCGSGAGGIVAARTCAGGRCHLTLADINPRALHFAAANAALAGCVDVKLVLGDLFEPTAGEFDLIVANPPYLNDAGQRLYRHGGGRWGEALSLRIVAEGLERLAPGGRLLLYTGVAIVDGEDPLLQALQGPLALRGWPWRYRELDPDVFGEELEQAAYSDADRIAVTALRVQRKDAPPPPRVDR